jgi:hypothetical protein
MSPASEPPPGDDPERRSGASRPGLLIDIAVAWPVWAGGYPAPTEAMMAAVSGSASGTRRAPRWRRFAEGFRRRSQVAADAPAAARMEAERWRVLADDLDRVARAFADVGSIDRFRRWAPRVARSSFQSGRVVLSRQRRRPEDGADRRGRPGRLRLSRQRRRTSPLTPIAPPRPPIGTGIFTRR